MSNLQPLIRLARLLPPEAAHRLAIRILPWLPAPGPPPGPRVRTLGLDFPSPVGLAAGFDKSALAYDALLGQGFGFVEIGTVTPRPQAGNPRPRLFRLEEDRAVINRMGFNNDGLEAVQRRLGRRDPARGIVGANIGMNRDGDPVTDYPTVFRGLYDLVDYLAVNLSSPNTPGLRALQAREPLVRLMGALLEARAARPGPPKPLLLKIAPDLTEPDEEAIAEVAADLRLDGLIVANTTIARPPGLRSRHRHETGGLSGAPLFRPSTDLLARMRRRLPERVVLIGAGGVSGAAEARAKLEAGAALVQLYTAMIYEGPGIARRIALELDRG
jgi:dihydroorotate dehydrogenase